MKKTKKILLFILSGIFIIAILVYQYLPQTPPLTFKKDARQMYNLNWRSVFLLNQPGGKSLHETLELHGTLNLRVFKKSEEKIKAGFQLSPLGVRKTGMDSGDAKEIYSKLFFADISPEGRFLDFEFSNEIARADENTLKDIIKILQVIVKETRFPGWETEEEDSSGAYIADYRVEDGVVEKGKREYLLLTDREGFIREGESAEIKKSMSEYHYNNRTTWLTKAEGSELLVFYSGKDPSLKVSITFSLELIPFNPDSGLAIWNDGLDADRQVAEWKRLPRNRVPLARKSEVDRLKDKFGNKSFSEVADGLFKVHKEFDVNCLRTLMEYLTMSPDAAYRIPEYLLSKKLNSTQKITLVHVLERVGTAEAQEALADIMMGQDFSKESRTQAAIGLGAMEKPEDVAVKSLWSAYEERGSGKRDADHVAATAVLSLGAMAKNLESSERRNYRAISEEIKGRISSDLAGNPDLNTKVALLHAAGNTADEEMVRDIRSYFNDDNPRVRSAAVNSLAYMDDGTVNEILTEELDYQDNVNVRNSIVTTMYRKEAGEDAVNKIIGLAPSEENDIVRGEMYRYLLKNRDMPGVKEALKGMLEKERSAEHRKIIRTALSTKKKASGDNG